MYPWSWNSITSNAIFQGNTYYDCITVTNSAGTEKEDITPWCPNKVHENKTYIEGQNIDCPTPKCSGCEFVLNYVHTQTIFRTLKLMYLKRF